ncbi:MAG: YdcF family protein [bacterium]|nr:YdcF family protein [bacterium]
MRYQKLKRIVFLILAILSMLYFCICLGYSGLGLSWIWVWLLIACFCGLRFLMLGCEIKGTAKWKLPRWFKIAYRVILAGTLLVFVITESQVISGMTTKPQDNLSYVVVLGAGVRGTTPTRPLLLRMKRAYEYMEANPDTMLIASGGQGTGEDISEAECIKRYLVEQGIDESRILLEDKSTSTEENLRNSFAMIPEDAGTVGILTNGFHIYRATLIAKELGHENVAGVPAITLMPVGIHYVVREFFAVMKLRLIPVS